MEEKSKRSFTYPEMVFLLIVLLLFLAGSVWVVNRAVANSHPPGRSDGASVIYASGATAVKARSIVVDRLDFLADLDGDPATGAFRVDSRGGYERVVVEARGGELVALVYEGPAQEPDPVVLTSGLIPGGPGAFSARLYGEDASLRRVGKVGVTLSTGARGSSYTSSNEFELADPPPLEIPPPVSP
jgi:hypothetical protein